MTFVSYARNFEDVLLWRALKDVTGGFYIDAGAADPDGGSATRAFYDRGWRGVNIAPSSPSRARLLAARPRDVTLLAGQRTLADIWREYVTGDVHFLTVAAEDDAQAVLQGADFGTRRPWIVLVRVPPRQNHAAWEPILLGAGYGFVWFDGLTRFYLAEERHTALAHAFATPPNLFDDFIRVTDSDLARRLAAAESGLAAAQAEAAFDRARAHDATRRLLDAVRINGLMRTQAAGHGESIGWLRALLEEAHDLTNRLRDESRWLRGLLETAQRQNEDHVAQLAGRTEEATRLQGSLAASEAALAAAARAHVQMQAAEAARANRAEQGERAAREQMSRAQAETAVLRASLSWRVTAPLRYARAVVLGRPNPVPEPQTPVPAPPPLEPVRAHEPPPVPAPKPAAVAPGPEPTPTPEPPAIPLPAPAPEPPISEPPTPEPPSLPVLPHPVHTVHQFHAGSAMGDAITNAMLMIRSMLRAMGYASEIFAEYVGEGLADELHTIDALPRHDGYVLLAHHSIGHPGFDRIVALPARKIIVYHNITPPELLTLTPYVPYALTGREQLAAWRAHAVASLADSEYNAIELRTLGFGAVRSCTLLFDLAVLRQQAAAVRIPPHEGPFTILFVGRITPPKAQDDLLSAYAAFCVRFTKPSRLVLVGAFDPNQVAYLDRLNEMILERGLDEQVLLTGLTPDAELHGWYARADLYVSLSHHEGFGVPLIEAMVHGVPVLAWPGGAVPYTLGGASVLLTSRDPAIVAGQMLALAEDPARRAAIVAQQTRSLDRFELARQAPLLQEALALAGAQPPPATATHRALAANLRVAFAGHVNKTYSLASVNRSMAAAFEQQRPGSVRLIPVEGQPTTNFSEVPPEHLAAVTALAARAAPVTGPEVVVSQHYPIFLPPERGDLTLAMVFWEESLLPAATVQTLNDRFDAVLAPSRFVAKALVDSGVMRPVLNVGQPLPPGPFAAFCDRQQRQPGPFTFLHVSSAFPRKGLDVLLAAWQQAFRAGDPVRLVIKTFPNPHNDAAAQIARLRAEDPGAAPITLIDRDLDEAAHLALLREAGAMVLPTRGEGYNLVAAEAMAAGVALIVTDNGGHRDFCGPTTARLIRSRPAPSGSHLATPHSRWAEPDRDDLAAAMQEAVQADRPDRIAAAHAAIAAHADPAAFVGRFADAAAALMLAPAAAPARIAWISTWNVRCGVAAYSRSLLEAMPADGIGRVAILCDDRTDGDDATIRPCWQIDTQDGAGRLLDTILSEDPDIVVVQHQQWLLGWGKLATLLARLSAAGRAVLTTLHNTQDLLDLPEAERLAAVTALGGIARVLVHTQADLERLGTLGLSDRVTLLPFGAAAPTEARPARTLPPGSAPLVGSYGFFLPGKGIGALIEAVSALRAQWPGIRLRLVNAEYADPSSAREIAACRAIAEAAGLAVEWHLDFLPDAESLALLRECDVIALPYAPSKEAASSAMRSALAARVPLAVSPIALFDEAAGAVARLPGHDPAAIAEGLAGLLADAAERDALNERAGAWLAGHDIGGIARRLHGMMLGLAAQRRVGAPLDGSTWPYNPA